MKIVVRHRVYDGAVEVHEFDRMPVIIGRGPEADVKFISTPAARLQAALIRRNGQFALVELGCASRTRVDGRLVPAYTVIPLRQGAKLEVAIGNYFVVECHASEGEPDTDWTEHPNPTVREKLKKIRLVDQTEAAAVNEIIRVREQAENPIVRVRLKNGSDVYEFERAPLTIGGDVEDDVRVTGARPQHVILFFRRGELSLVARDRTRMEGELVREYSVVRAGALIELGDGLYVTVDYEASGREPETPWAWTEHRVPAVREMLESIDTEGPAARRAMRDIITYTLQTIASNRLLLEQVHDRLFFVEVKPVGYQRVHEVAVSQFPSLVDTIARAGQRLDTAKELARSRDPESLAQCMREFELAEVELRDVLALTAE